MTHGHLPAYCKSTLIHHLSTHPFSGPSVDDMSKLTNCPSLTDFQTCGGLHAHGAFQVMIIRRNVIL